MSDLIRFCDSTSVLPLWISETGHVNELPSRNLPSDEHTSTDR